MHRLARVSLAALLVAAFSGPVRAGTPYWSTDFEGGIPAEFGAPGSALAPVQGWAGLGIAGNQFGGSFLRYSAVPLSDTRLVLRGLPPHTHVSVGFLLAIIDSWDGTELFQVRVDGALLFDHTFQIATGDTSSYLAPAGGLLSRGVNLGYSSGSYYGRDRAYDIGVDPAFQDIPHTADSLVVAWSLGAVSGPAATQWQGGDDESWAIDNVRVSLTAPPLDAAPARPQALALSGSRPNPSRDGRLRAAFILPTAEPARLEAFDASGRRLASRDVGGLGPGRHLVDLGDGAALAPGLYLLRLVQGDVSRTARAVLVR